MRMNGCVEDILGHINGIGDDNNICNTLYLRWSTNVTSNSKKFSFGWWNIYSMINGFDNDFISPLYMWDWSSNIVIDACIRYDKNGVLVHRGILVDVLEFVLVDIYS